MKKLFLDDIRNPPDKTWAIVRTYDQFVKVIETLGLPDVISFDHDLADEHYQDYLSDENFEKPDEQVSLSYNKYNEMTGYSAAVYLVNYCLENQVLMPQCFVHSQNPVGSENIIRLINNYCKTFKQDQTCRKVF